MRHWVETILAWAVLAILLGALAWHILVSAWSCTFSTCSETDAASAGSVLGLALLIGVPALFRWSTRKRRLIRRTR